MKRSLITAVIIAVVVGAVAIISHATGWFAAIDMPLKNWLQKLNGPSHDLSKIWQPNLIVVLGLATAWITITNARRHSIAILVLAIVVELLALTAARPSELLRLTPADLDRGGEVELARGYRVKLPGVWCVQPSRHKTSRKGKRRVIYITPKFEALLRRLVAKHATGLLFRTQKGGEWTADALCYWMRELEERLLPGVEILLC